MARLNLIGATVTTPSDGDHAGVQIIVRNDLATVTTPKGALVTKRGVVTVADAGPRSKTVTFDDGTAWDVTVPERKPCNCH